MMTLGWLSGFLAFWLSDSSTVDFHCISFPWYVGIEFTCTCIKISTLLTHCLYRISSDGKTWSIVEITWVVFLLFLSTYVRSKNKGKCPWIECHWSIMEWRYSIALHWEETRKRESLAERLALGLWRGNDSKAFPFSFLYPFSAGVKWGVVCYTHTACR